MQKDDFRHTLSFGADLFDGRVWKTMVPPDVADRCLARQTVPVPHGADGKPLKRNFVDLADLTDALFLALDNPVIRGRTYNVAMDEPVDYGDLAA